MGRGAVGRRRAAIRVGFCARSAAEIAASNSAPLPSGTRRTDQPMAVKRAKARFSEAGTLAMTVRRPSVSAPAMDAASWAGPAASSAGPAISQVR